MRLRRCTCVHCTGYGASAVYSNSLMSCLFCVRGAARRHGGGRNSLSNPKGVTPAAARTVLFFTLPVCSCKKVPSASALPLSHSLGSRRPGVSLSSRASPEGSRPAFFLFECHRHSTATVGQRLSSRTRPPPSVFSRVLERTPPSSSCFKTATRQLTYPMCEFGLRKGLVHVLDETSQVRLAFPEVGGLTHAKAGIRHAAISCFSSTRYGVALIARDFRYS